MDTSFLCGLSGTVITPCDTSYNQDRQGFNHAVSHYPLIINYCRTVTDVSNAVLWARNKNIPLRIRSGGHNYEGYSSGDNLLVIDVSEMNNIQLDNQSRTVRVQGGVTNGQLYDYVGSRGYPFPGGTCPTVGVSGYALGGGWGLSCRNFGLGCDSIQEIELINYEGQHIIANSRCNADLYWACRGAGGGNFGVVTSLTFQLPPPVRNVTLIEIDYLHVDTQTQALFLQTWQNWLDCADQRITLISRIYNSTEDGLAMLIRGIFYGDSLEAIQLVQSFLNLEGAISNIQYVTFLEAVTILGSSYPAFEKFESTSRFVYKYYNPCEINTLVSLIQDLPRGSVYIALSMYALGGEVAETGINETAFFHRDAHYILWLDTVWEEDRFAADNAAWINEQFQYLAPLTKGSYVNFPYDELPCYQSQYYGYHVACLNSIKQKYDPCNIFSFPQGLGNCCRYDVDKRNIKKRHLPNSTQNMPEQTPNIITNCRGFRYVKPRP